MISSNVLSLNASDYPVKSVTIFQSSTAELTRTLSVDLQAGRNVVKITGISSRIDAESPRIHGLGTGARVLDISCQGNYTAATNRKQGKNEDEIRRLRVKIRELQAERDIRQHEYELLNQISNQAAKSESLLHDKPTDLNAFVDNVVRRKRDAQKAILDIGEQLDDLNGELGLLSEIHKGETTARVVANILAKSACIVEFQLTYLVTGVTWQPYYNLHASTADGKPSPYVCLQYCANITQRTGEDWNDTSLKLSTTNSQALESLSIPKINSLKISPRNRFGGINPQVMASRFGSAGTAPPQAQVFGAFGQRAVAVQQNAGPTQGVGLFGQSSAMAQGGGLFGSTSNTAQNQQPGTTVATGNPSVEGDDLEIIEHDVSEGANLGQGAAVDRNPLSLAYHVDGNVTLPSDGIPHKVSIATLDFFAELKYVCVPRKNTSAYIEGSVKNTSEYELLAGPVSVFMDEGFVTKTSLDLIGVNESFNCVLGVDIALKVSYQRKSRTAYEPPRNFAEPTKTTTQTITTTVANSHAFDIGDLVIRDVIPLGNKDSNIQVTLLKPDGLALTKDGENVSIDLGEDVKNAKVRWSKVENGHGGEKDGMFEWICVVPAGKKAKLEVEYTVKAPGHIQWEEM